MLSQHCALYSADLALYKVNHASPQKAGVFGCPSKVQGGDLSSCNQRGRAYMMLIRDQVRTLFKNFLATYDLMVNRSLKSSSRILRFHNNTYPEVAQQRRLGRKLRIFISYISIIYSIFCFFCTNAGADISDVYVKSTCDPAHGIAKITIDRVEEGDKPPENSQLLSSIHDHRDPTTPLKLCSLGKKREISFLGSVDLVHPRNDELEIHIGTSALPYGINVSTIINTYFVTLRKKNQDYYVSIEECDSAGHCRSKLRTDPSFDCARASQLTEKIICHRPDLAELDIKLNNAYILALSRSKDKRLFIENQIKWVNTRDVVCKMQSSSDRRGISELNSLNPIDCLIKYYTERLIFLEGLIGP